ncbi:hypothetical protein C8R42DRAFT_640845 [Lentinula raphanica]|nr:hypothetical protein C8R42DRAFT_640845 [Lentinula raphanica]
MPSSAITHQSESEHLYPREASRLIPSTLTESKPSSFCWIVRQDQPDEPSLMFPRESNAELPMANILIVAYHGLSWIRGVLSRLWYLDINPNPPHCIHPSPTPILGRLHAQTRIFRGLLSLSLTVLNVTKLNITHQQLSFSQLLLPNTYRLLNLNNLNCPSFGETLPNLLNTLIQINMLTRKYRRLLGNGKVTLLDLLTPFIQINMLTIGNWETLLILLNRLIHNMLTVGNGKTPLTILNRLIHNMFLVGNGEMPTLFTLLNRLIRILLTRFRKYHLLIGNLGETLLILLNRLIHNLLAQEYPLLNQINMLIWKYSLVMQFIKVLPPSESSRSAQDGRQRIDEKPVRSNEWWHARLGDLLMYALGKDEVIIRDDSQFGFHGKNLIDELSKVKKDEFISNVFFIAFGIAFLEHDEDVGMEIPEKEVEKRKQYQEMKEKLNGLLEARGVSTKELAKTQLFDLNKIQL